MKHAKTSPKRATSAEAAKHAPGLGGILETVLYARNLEAAEDFYCRVLGLERIFSVPSRQLVFRCENGFLLVFNPDHTERNRIHINGSVIPLHGARGAGHMAFGVAKRALAAWRQTLRDAGVPIESEVAWPNGARSIYFRDPAGNSLELATPDMWKKTRR
jgi:catechol 2,3-dioxygenase-like lactoylglutathione lyase family enzyme